MNRHLQYRMKAVAKSTLIVRANRNNEFMASKILKGMKENIRAIAKGKGAEKEQGGGGGRFLFRGRRYPAALRVEVSPL